MKETNIEFHVNHLVSDYIFDLLSDEQNYLVASHVAHCSDCNKVLQQERQIGRLIHETLSELSKPDPRRLQQLRPMAGLQPSRQTLEQWQFRLAIVTLLLLIIFGALSFQFQLQNSVWQPHMSTAYSTSATMTNTPTQTVVITRNEVEPLAVSQPTPAASNSVILPHPAVVPVPVAPLLR